MWNHADAKTFLSYVSNAIICAPKILQTRTLNCVDAAMAGRTYRFTVFPGTTVELDGSVFSGAREIYCRGVYFALPGFDIGSEDTSVDLGANVGVFTTFAARRGKRVIAVEAQSGFIPFISENLQRNNCLNKAAVEFGLIGSKSGKLSDPAERKNCSHWGQEAPVLSLPDVLRRHGVNQVDFLKIDIEGSEFDLFDGDVSWLKDVKKIAMEVHCEFGDVNSLCHTLKTSGFHVWLVGSDQTVVSSLTDSSGYLFALRAS